MTVFVPIMLFGWLPFTLVLFSLMRSRQAAVVSLILGWLFLPGAVYDFPGIPGYNRTTAICFSIILGTLLLDTQCFKKLQIGKLDIPIIVWCLGGFFSSLSNGLGVYDGVASVLRHVFDWGLPYTVGKIYFSDRQGLRELAVWIVIGGLIYIPFCIWEMRMGPTLHYYFYGFRMDKYATTIRFGGYRPSVFLRHGLAVGVWMMSSLLMGIWLWRTKAVKVLCRFSMGFNVAALSIIFLLCRSLNAIILFAGGLLSYFAIRSLGLKSIALCLALMPVFYLVGRNIEIISAENLVETARRIDSDRATSLHIRLRHEELLAKKAWHRPLLGWGGYGRNRLQDEYGNDASITDAFWVSAFGVYGLVGLVSVGFVMLLPTVVFWSRYRTADWGDPELSPIAALVCIIPLYVIDCLMNTMLNPVFTVAAGGILGWLANKDDEPLSTSV